MNEQESTELELRVIDLEIENSMLKQDIQSIHSILDDLEIKPHADIVLRFMFFVRASVFGVPAELIYKALG